MEVLGWRELQPEGATLALRVGSRELLEVRIEHPVRHRVPGGVRHGRVEDLDIESVVGSRKGRQRRKCDQSEGGSSQQVAHVVVPPGRPSDSVVANDGLWRKYRKTTMKAATGS